MFSLTICRFQIPREVMQATGKYFVLKHVLHVSKMKENEQIYSKVEEHFGVEWYDTECSFFEFLILGECVCAGKKTIYHSL